MPNRQGTIRITLNGRELPLDPSGESGWMWTDQGNGELSLSASDCAEANAASSQASAELTCEATGGAGGPGL